MSRAHRPEPRRPRPILREVDAAILLTEEQAARTEALRARLAAAGWAEDAAYARALLGLARGHLTLLRWRREELLARERPREEGGALGTLLGRVLGFARAARRQPSTTLL